MHKNKFRRNMKYQLRALQSVDKDYLRECPVCSQACFNSQSQSEWHTTQSSELGPHLQEQIHQIDSLQVSSPQQQCLTITSLSKLNGASCSTWDRPFSSVTEIPYITEFGMLVGKQVEHG